MNKNINFRTMACSLKPSRVAPVGDAFAQYKKNYGEEEWMKLFMKAEDDHHSSVKGSYLAACVHYRGVRHNSYHQHFYETKSGMDPEALARIGMLWLSMRNRPIQLTKIARCQDSMVHDMGMEKWE